MSALYGRMFGQVGSLAGQNALRNPRRTAATASALMIGLALVTTMAIVGASPKASVDKTIADNFQGDLFVSNVVGEPFSPSLGDAMEKIARRRRGDPGPVRDAEIDGKDQGVTAVDPASLVRSVRVAMVQGDARRLARRHRAGQPEAGDRRPSRRR